MESHAPYFVAPECRAWFYHWLTRSCECPVSCTACLRVKENVDFATTLMIEALVNQKHRFTSGSDVVTINLGHMSYTSARAILRNHPRVMDSEDEKRHLDERTKATLNRDFPGLVWHASVTTPRSFGVYAPLLVQGATSIYTRLVQLYGAVLQTSTRSKNVFPLISTVRFCLLCFHLNQQYMLTPDSVTQMWTEPLAINTITTLLHDPDTLSAVVAQLSAL